MSERNGEHGGEAPLRNTNSFRKKKNVREKRSGCLKSRGSFKKKGATAGGVFSCRRRMEKGRMWERRVDREIELTDYARLEKSEIKSRSEKNEKDVKEKSPCTEIAWSEKKWKPKFECKPIVTS